MKIFTLVIADAVVPKKSPKCKYELVIKYMHGDADAYTTESWLFHDLNTPISKYNPLITLNTVFNFIEKFKELDWNSQCNFEKYIDFDKALMEGLSDCEFFPGDSTCDGQVPARPDEFSLYWWDENGTKFNVNVFGDSNTQLLPGNR